MKLLNATRNSVLVENLTKAETFFARLRGLLGRKSLAAGEGLWLTADGIASIHTFFMNFAIDVIFVDSESKVCAVYPNLVPWRLTRIVFGVDGIFELAAGTLQKNQVAIGDQLHVVS